MNFPEHLFHHVCRRCRTYQRRCNYRIFNPGNACLLEQKAESGGEDEKAERETLERDKESVVRINEEIAREDDSLALSMLEEQSKQNQQPIDDDRHARDLIDFMDERL